MKKTALYALSLIALLAAPARAEVSLHYHWSNVRCGTTSGGVTTYADCSSPSFSATVYGSVSVSATFEYTYHDDGMRLGTPEFFQLDPRGFNMLRVDNEAAIIYFNNFGASPSPTQLDRIWSTNLPVYLMLGNNATPDDLTGSLQFFWTASVVPNYYPEPVPLTLGASLFVLHTEIAAVPEPSTTALMGLGIVGLAGFARRRLREQAARL